MKSLGKKPSGARLERIQTSPLWTGERFANAHRIAPGLRDPNVPMPSLRDFLCGGERRVPRGQLPSINPLDTWMKPPESGLRATWLGHSTVLIEIDGVRVLTDPVWGPRASPSRFAGPKRFQPVPVGLAAMPPIDLVVISHDHYDHLDYPTILELAKLDVPFVTSLGVGAHLEAWGIAPERITELDWWDSRTLPNSGITVTAAPSLHFSGRGLKDRNQTLWSSLVIRSPNHSVFFWRRYRPHDGISVDPRAARAVRSGDAGSRRISPRLGRYRYPSGAGERIVGACVARRRRVSAGALGYVQSRDACVGSAGRGAAVNGRKGGCATDDAAIGRADRARACAECAAMVAQCRYDCDNTRAGSASTDHVTEIDAMAD